MPFPVTEDRVAAAEAELGRRLPESLRGHLLQSNGGEVEAAGDVWQLHPVWDPSDRKRAGRTANHIVGETARAREWPGFPGGAISVAANGSGDHLILESGGDAFALWDHETGTVEPIDVEF